MYARFLKSSVSRQSSSFPSTNHNTAYKSCTETSQTQRQQLTAKKTLTPSTNNVTKATLWAISFFYGQVMSTACHAGQANVTKIVRDVCCFLLSTAPANCILANCGWRTFEGDNFTSLVCWPKNRFCCLLLNPCYWEYGSVIALRR